jgi:opine dehydrogenase
LIVTPAFAHKTIAKQIAPFLKEDQIILLNPGRTFGAVEFRRMIEKKGINFIVSVNNFLLFLDSLYEL